jgi:hypothetical protein
MKTGRLTMQGEGMRDDDWLDLGGAETAELTESFWRSPERLRHAAARLREKAQRVDHRFTMLEPEETKPEPPALQELVGFPRVDADFEADAETARINQARMQILMAVEREKQEAADQQVRARKQARNAVAGSALGRLVRIPYER